MIGYIFDIKRFAVHDGPGVRSTIFLSGCTLNCKWCHNPESRLPFSEWEGTREVTVDMMINEISRDNILFEESGGGVTFSGGEPLYQYDFLIRLLDAAASAGFHTAVDTTGFAEQDKIRSVAEIADLFLYDLKILDNDKHKKYTGVENKLILSNLEFLVSRNKETVVRIPLVSGFNDSPGDLNDSADFVRDLGGIERVDILPFHRYGISKYRKLGLGSSMEDFKKPDDKRIEQAKEIFTERGIKVSIGG